MMNTMPSKAPPVLPSERQLLSDLGARLRLARQRRKLAASAVARQAGISRTTLHNAESGDAAVTLGTYLRVLASLGLEQDIAMLAADDKLGRRLQDMQLEHKGAQLNAARRASTPEYLFAMKCMAMRPEGIDGSHDISDIKALANAAGIKSVEQALSLVTSFYPASQIPPKVRFGVQEIMEQLEAGGASRPG
jgi:transcriptional regulator with XRE-family HTH domain